MDVLTTGDIGRRLGQPTWLIRYLADRLPNHRRCGQYRMLSEADVEPIRELVARHKARPLARGPRRRETVTA